MNDWINEWENVISASDWNTEKVLWGWIPEEVGRLQLVHIPLLAGPTRYLHSLIIITKNKDYQLNIYHVSGPELCTLHSALKDLGHDFKAPAARGDVEFPISGTFLSPAGWRDTSLNNLRIIFWDVNRWRLLFLIFPAIPYGRGLDYYYFFNSVSFS